MVVFGYNIEAIKRSFIENRVELKALCFHEAAQIVQRFESHPLNYHTTAKRETMGITGDSPVEFGPGTSLEKLDHTPPLYPQSLPLLKHIQQNLHFSYTQT